MSYDSVSPLGPTTPPPASSKNHPDGLLNAGDRIVTDATAPREFGLAPFTDAPVGDASGLPTVGDVAVGVS